MSEQRVVVMGLATCCGPMKASACGWRNGCMPLPLARGCGDCRWRHPRTELAGYVESASHLLILDAIDYGLDPERYERMPENAFRLISARRNEPAPEQFLRSAGAGRYPRTLPAHIALVGLQPAMLDDYGAA